MQSLVKIMHKLRRIISLALLTTVGLLAALINPLVILFASISIIAFLTIVRQMNFYKIVMMIKGYAKTVSRLRFEIRAKIHTGFRDCSSSVENTESRHRNCGYLR